jgi:hypothetical protein
MTFRWKKLSELNDQGIALELNGYLTFPEGIMSPSLVDGDSVDPPIKHTQHFTRR